MNTMSTSLPFFFCRTVLLHMVNFTWTQEMEEKGGEDHGFNFDYTGKSPQV